GQVTIDSDGRFIKTLGTLTDLVGISSNTYNGQTTFDITAGKSAYIRLVAQQIMGKSKNSQTGVTKKFGDGFGAKTRKDVLYNFLENKVTPPVRGVIDFAKGRDFSGKKPTLSSTAFNMFIPISLQNAFGIFGIGATDGEDWNNKTSKEMEEFKAQ